MSNDIVDRLGTLGETLRLEHWPFWWTNYCHEGAAEIVRLRTRVAELEADVRHLEKEIKYLSEGDDDE